MINENKSDNNKVDKTEKDTKAMIELLRSADPSMASFGGVENDKEKLIEAFILFQKFMTMNQLINQNVKDNNNQQQVKSSPRNESRKDSIAQNKNEDSSPKNEQVNQEEQKPASSNNDNNVNNPEQKNEQKNQLVEDIIKEDKSIQEPKDQPLKTESKNQTIETKENKETEGREDTHENGSRKNESQKELPKNDFDETPIRPMKTPINFDDIPIKPQANNAFDEMPIKGGNSNFLELLEKNLQNEDQNYPSNSGAQKPIKKFTRPPPRKKIEISKPTKGEIKKYKYYSDHFQEEDKKQEEEREKKKGLKEKSKEYSQKVLKTQKPPEKKEELPIQKPINPYSKPIAKSENRLPKKENSVSNTETNRWKEAKFDELNNENTPGSQPEKKEITQHLEFGTNGNHRSSSKGKFVVGIQQNDSLIQKNNFNTVSEGGVGLTQPNISQNEQRKNKSSSNLPINVNVPKKGRAGGSPMKKSLSKPTINNTTGNVNSKSKKRTSQSIPQSEADNLKQSEELGDINQYEHFEELSKLIIEPKSNETLLSDKISELNKQIQKLKLENTRVSKLREEYEKLNQKLQKEKKEFNVKKEQEMMDFEAFKDEEIKKLAKEKRQLANEQKQFTDYKNKSQTALQSNNKKDKEILEQMKQQLIKQQEESKIKENTNKLLIERYKKQLEDANNKIAELNTILSQLTETNQAQIQQPKKQNTNKNSSSQLSSVYQAYNTNSGMNSGMSVVKTKTKQTKQSMTSNDEEEENYDMVFPDKYHKAEFHLLRTEPGNDGKIIKYYDGDKKEIIFKSGVRKEVFGDGYQMVYFNNGDLKQMFPNGKVVYFFNEDKTIQTTYPDQLQVFKFENGQVERHHPDGTKQIAFPDGSLRYIFPDGEEETYYLDGKVQKTSKDGVITIEHENGYKEIKYPDGREVVEYGNSN